MDAGIFSITTLYETKNHIDSYCQVALHKLTSINILDKNPNDATISIVFNNFIAALCDYGYTGRIPEALDERTCITLLNSLINPVDDLRWHIKIF